VAVLDLPGWAFTNYVIEIDTHLDPLLKVRSALTMSDAADKPSGAWRNITT
jgi:hypothetical protein